MLPEKGWVRLKVQGKDEEGGRGAQSFSLRRISAPPTGPRLNLWDAIGEAFSFASRPLLRRWSLRERGKERSTMGSLKGERSTSAICRPAASPKSGAFLFLFSSCFILLGLAQDRFRSSMDGVATLVAHIPGGRIEGGFYQPRVYFPPSLRFPLSVPRHVLYFVRFLLVSLAKLSKVSPGIELQGLKPGK